MNSQTEINRITYKKECSKNVPSKSGEISQLLTNRISVFTQTLIFNYLTEPMMNVELNIAVVQVENNKVREKWAYLSSLITAKEKHREIFYNKMRNPLYTPNHDNHYEYRNKYITMVRGETSIKQHIEEILRRKNIFLWVLGYFQEKKFDKYVNHRKTMTMPNYNDTTEYNPENDCPVCFENFKDEEGDIYGRWCSAGREKRHLICYECWYDIRKDTNKCPICREKLDDEYEAPIEEDEEEDENESEEDVWRGHWVVNDEGIQEWIAEEEEEEHFRS